MDCSQLQEELCAYVDNELDSAGRARVEAHTIECEACAEDLSAHRSLKALVARSRLYAEEPPQTLQVLPEPDLALSPRRSARLPWLHRPLQAHSVALVAAAAGIALFFGFRQYEAQYMRGVQHREAVLAHLRGMSDARPSGPSPVVTTAVRPVGDELYAHADGLMTVGHGTAFETTYFLGSHAVSQLRFLAGEFDDQGFERQNLNGREYRVGRCGEYSIATYRRGPTQIVLVSSAPPEALLVLARNLPPDTPFQVGPTGY